MRRDVMILIIVAIAMIVCEMMIDHRCYQLTPNDFYQSTICERYWKYEK